MKFPTIEEMAQNVAEKALDEYEYKGRTIRQWIEIISASEHGTNLAEVGTDTISRQSAIEAVQNRHMMLSKEKVLLINDLEKLPSAESKRGYWIKTGDKEETYGVVSKCSVCGAIDYEGNFCPNCGAKMEVNNESN